MKRLNAFTMIELIFVIVVMGIVANFGMEFLAKSYGGFIFSKVNNTLQAKSATAIEFIASRLQYRIKDSIISRVYNGDQDDFRALQEADEDDNMIEWTQIAIDSFRGDYKPFWSGVLDLDLGNKDKLVLLESNTTAINEIIDALSYGYSDVNDSVLYFIGAPSDINEFGWDANEITDQNKTLHRVKADDNNESIFLPKVSNFEGVDIYEYYHLSWSANAIALTDYNETTKMGTLKFFYNYQPWEGDSYKDANTTTIMENVSTFRVMAIGATIKIQVCVKSNLVEEYSLCKEKTIF